jgi:hypothetical protein
MEEFAMDRTVQMVVGMGHRIWRGHEGGSSDALLSRMIYVSMGPGRGERQGMCGFIVIVWIAVVWI